MNSELSQLIFSNPLLTLLAIVVSIWTMFWKAVALWRAATHSQRNWFVALFILLPVNILGIIEIIFLFFYSKKKLTLKELKGWFVRRQT